MQEKTLSMKRPKKRMILIILCVLVCGVIVILLRSAPAVALVVRNAKSAQEHIATAVSLWDESGIERTHEIANELEVAQRELSWASEQLEAEVLLRLVPGVSGMTSNGVRALRGAAQWTGGMYELASVAAKYRSLLEYIPAKPLDALSDDERATVYAALGEGIASVRDAGQSFEEGAALLEGARCPFFIAPFVEACSLLDPEQMPDEFIRVSTLVREGTSAIDSVLRAAMTDHPTDILLLFLNNTEIRPGGGFLGTYGLATIEHGALTKFMTDDVYNLDKLVIGTQQITPPQPFRDHGIVNYWYLRDANWSPDFAVSSSMVLDFYQREGGPGDPSIVIGFTPTLAEQLLELVGSVTVEGVQFTSENIADELEYQVELAYDTKGIPRPQRKAIIASLSEVVIDRLRNLPVAKWPLVLRVLRDAMLERQLMAYSTETAMQKHLERFGVAGRVQAVAPGDDFLMVVDANMGALKTDPVVQRSVRYAIIPDALGGYRATVDLHYRNVGTFTWKTTRYRTYTRVYLPAGTQLIATRGAMESDRSSIPGRVDVYDDLDRTAFGAFISIEPGQERTLSFDVQLAPEVAERIRRGSYGLAVQKQLGSLATTLTVDHEFGTPVEAAVPAEVPAEWGNSRYTYKTDLQTDRIFRVNLK
ncbi:MAG: DUF4012 domain-containing protein [Candidatus Uhrbacteria bacterium]